MILNHLGSVHVEVDDTKPSGKIPEVNSASLQEHAKTLTVKERSFPNEKGL